MTLLQAIILGAVQGATEFIPVSSSAHLVVIPWLLHWKTPDLSFYVALHVGTLLALFWYFWREWKDMLRARLRRAKPAVSVDGQDFPAIPHSIRLRTLALSCVPAITTGMALEFAAERCARHPVLIGVIMAVFGVLLYAADRSGKKSRSIHDVRTRDWLLIGLAQAFAIIPGVSRSGSTITAGLLQGFEREAAARFSFLIGVPVVFGAALFELIEMLVIGLPATETSSFIMGVLTAAIVGYLCIGFLLDYLKTRGLMVFVVYRIILGGALLIVSAIRA